MRKSSDSIMGCAALLQEAEARAARAFTKWTETNVRFKALIEPGDGEPLPGAVAIDSAWLHATASYEAMLDTQREKAVLRAKLFRLKAENEAKRTPIRRLPAPGALPSRGSLDTRATRYCQLRATGASPADALQMAGYTPGVMDVETLERDARVVAKIAELRSQATRDFGEDGDFA